MGRGRSKINNTNSVGGGSSKTYLDPAHVTYTSNDEVLYVERLPMPVGSHTVLQASAQGTVIDLGFAKPDEYFKQNSKTTYSLYKLECGITDAADIHGSRTSADIYQPSKTNTDNENGGIRSVGIEWDNVTAVTGPTYQIKDFLKYKGFKWNGSNKRWEKP